MEARIFIKLKIQSAIKKVEDIQADVDEFKIIENNNNLD